MKSAPVFDPQAVRPPAVAGMFYTEHPRQLAQEVKAHLDHGLGEARDFPKAIIAPHAGYVYSGPIAGSAFKPWLHHRETIKRVVLIGPSHHVAFDGLALSHYGLWRSPLGLVKVDAAAIEQIARRPQVRFFEAAHEREHSLEVELAFLQSTLAEFSIVPIVTGDVGDDAVADVIATLWGGPETVIVISSDLSHFYDYATACKLDRATADAIEALDPGAIHPRQACGRLAIQGLLQAAQDRKCAAATVDLRNSGDTAGSKDRVVGYGAFSFVVPP